MTTSDSDQGRNRHWLIAALVLVACWFVLAWPWLSGQVTVPWDAKAHFQPQLQFLATAFHTGQSPFWAPYVFAGHPQVADPQSLIFSPPHVLLALASATPSMAAADGVALGMLLLGGLALLVLFRDRGWHEAGAFVAALAFIFGGAAAWRIQHTGQVLSLAYWPIALVLLERALARGSWPYGIAAGVSAGLMLIGRDQVAFLGALLLGGRVLAHWLQATRPWRALSASVLPLTLATLAGTLVVAVPLLLTMLLAADSNRAVFGLGDAERGSLHPASLLTLVVPHLYGIARPLIDYWGPPSPDWGPTDLYLARNMATLYLGILPVMLALGIGAFRGAFRAGEIRYFVIATAFTLLYALGRYTPVFGWIFAFVPGVDLFRRPADALFLFCALLGILGGYGLHRFLAEPGVPMPRLLLVGEGGLVAVILAVSVWLAWSVGRLGQEWPAILSAFLFALAALLALVLARRHRRHRTLVLLGLAVLMALDLGVNNGPNESTALPPDTYAVLDPTRPNSTIDLLRRQVAATAGPDRRDRIELLGIDFHWPNASLVHNLDHTLGYNPVRLRHYAEASGAEDHIALPDQRRFTPLFPSYASPLANLLGLGVIASRVPLGEVDRLIPPGRFPLIGRTDEAFVYSNPEALPRVLFATRVASGQFDTMIKTGIWPSTDFRNVVILDEPEAGRHPDRSGSGTARLLAYGNTDIRIETNSSDGGYLVLNDVWQPWWDVEVDGQKAELLRANVIMRAVPVPAGRHEVRFVFRPFQGALRQVLSRLGW